MVQANIHEIFTDDQIAQFTAEDHWPPPDGLTFLKETKPDPATVTLYARALASVLPPAERNLVREIFKLD